MRLAIAAVFQLTNTFCRLPTSFSSFDDDAASPSGGQPCDPFHVRGLIRQIGELCKRNQIDMTVGQIAIARASGPATHDCAAQLSRQLCRAATESASNVDAFVLVLSGTMLDEDLQSVDEQLIEVVRKTLNADVPLIVLLSDYANVTDQLVTSNISESQPIFLLGFDHDDHECLDRTARSVLRACEHLVDSTVGQTTLVRRLPLLVPPANVGTHDEVMCSLKTIAAEFIADPEVLDVSFYPGFPYADVNAAGFGISVTAPSDKAKRLLQRLYRAVWDRREEFGVFQMNVEIAVHAAMLANPGPVVVADLGDDPVFGACGDGTGLLWALIDLGAPDATLGVIVDPLCVAAAIESGVGTRLKFDVGGGLDHRAGYPVQVEASVRKVSDGHLTVDEGCTINLGRSVVLDVQGRHGGQIDLIVCEQAPQMINPSVFSALGIDISRKKIVGVKSSTFLDQHFGSIADTVIRTSTPGITTPVLNYFDYLHVQRPIYPIDAV